MFESSFFNFFKIYFFYGKIWTSILIFFLAILHLLLSHYKSFPLAFIWSCCCIYKIFCVGDFSGHFSLCCWVACQFLSSTASLSLSFILLTMKKSLSRLKIWLTVIYAVTRLLSKSWNYYWKCIQQKILIFY